MISQSALSAASSQCAVERCTPSANLSDIIFIPLSSPSICDLHIKMCQSRACVIFGAQGRTLLFPFHIIMCYAPRNVIEGRDATCLASNTTKAPCGCQNDRIRKAQDHRSGMADHRSGARLAGRTQHFNKPLGSRCRTQSGRPRLPACARPGADPLSALRSGRSFRPGG